MRRARDINRAFSVIERGPTQQHLSPMDLHAFLSSASRIHRRIREGNPYRRREIHRFHPRQDLGESLGLMNLDGERIGGLVDRGYQDAAQHDCGVSGCVLPEEDQANSNVDVVSTATRPESIRR